MSATAERIPVELYFDYVCPFCYIGWHRLARVVADYPVAVHYRFLEIHPDNPAQGRPVTELGYLPEQWQAMTANLERMAAEDGLPLAERDFTTNSRQALLLAQTVFDQRPEAFLPLHAAIFHAYFVERRNIGDEAVLRELAAAHGAGDLTEQAWQTQAPLERLLEHVEAARRIGLSGVPTLVVGKRAFPGAVSVDTLERALREQGIRPAAREH
ncbi:DsbA family oxidoreductase [Spiribacter halobius]|uniref:DsbA family protein n=1 Tax=Sediminicurvatus halobius TaxID=2182432 RepID=A0A2U2MZZ3_9GAMM|nr:DsbA family protein [Spiribacter halobius]PWG62382.1 DsbA family protein [Spiribacter halobius]UEX79480.1 DsbA family protein [Spiribacter halobius]